MNIRINVKTKEDINLKSKRKQTLSHILRSSMGLSS
ncbi:hypothetical protein BACFRA24663_16830 [Bacteroides fragilis]